MSTLGWKFRIFPIALWIVPLALWCGYTSWYFGYQAGYAEGHVSAWNMYRPEPRSLDDPGFLGGPVNFKDIARLDLVPEPEDSQEPPESAIR